MDHPRPSRFRSQASQSRGTATSQRLRSKSEPRGHVSCRRRSETSLQRLPLTRSEHPSQGYLLPCGHPPACRDARLDACHRRFRRRPRFHAVAWLPPAAMGPLFRYRSTLPGRPGLESRNRPVPLASPASELSSSRKSVRTGSSCLEPEAVPLLVFRLSRAFSAHTSEPRTRPILGTEHASSLATRLGTGPESPKPSRASTSDARHKGPHDPSRRVSMHRDT